MCFYFLHLYAKSVKHVKENTNSVDVKLIRLLTHDSLRNDSGGCVIHVPSLVLLNTGMVFQLIILKKLHTKDYF